MAVIAVWKCDRDGAMFENKKDAEEHDNMLELAANITHLLEQEIPDLNDQQGETIGLILAKHREILAKACKGKPSVLLDEISNTSSSESPQPSASEAKKPEANTTKDDDDTVSDLTKAANQ